MSIIYNILANQGLQMGAGTIVLGIIMDISLDKEQIIWYLKNNPKLLYEGYKASTMNLLVYAPIYYSLAKSLLINKSEESFNIVKFVLITNTHSLGYYMAHYGMHRINVLRYMHIFHHKYKLVFPSVGNAVTFSEFSFAYVSPFIVAAYLFNPNELTFKMSILFISIFNLIIHSTKLKNIEYPSILVSPKDHGIHHIGSTRENETYSAPFIKLDNMWK